MRRPTLEEKNYGPGFRPVAHSTAVAPWSGCGVEGCTARVHGSVELYVDDAPPLMDWYSRLLRKLPPNVWTRVRFCESHLADVTRKSVDEFWDVPDLWAPWRASPPVLMHPPIIAPQPKLVGG